VFAAWMRILKRVPKTKLWMLKFTAQGAENLLKSAKCVLYLLY
jgi:predicted O-linked N-acetylglucosamine transferase (SPINDLY family)